MGRKGRAPQTVLEKADAILADPHVAWLPIRHHSPGCAWHVARWIQAHRPAIVLVEGPDDANELLRYLVAPEAVPPVAVLSTWTDTKATLGTPDVDGTPATWRSLFPLVGHGPEWAALREGHAVGAALRFVDLPHDQLVKATGQADAGGRHLAESAWFRRLAERTGRPGFDAFFDATFEARAHTLDSAAFFRELLVFALCTREASPDEASLEADGTTQREAHMAWHVAEARKAHPDGRVCVVTGAFHTAALPFTKPRRTKPKADRGTRVLLTTTSHRSLVRLANVPSPAWAQALHGALARGEPDPARVAAETLLVQVAAGLRDAGAPVGTADAVAAVTMAVGLGRLRGGGPAADDVREVAMHAFVRGDTSLVGAPVAAVVDAVFTGRERGTLPVDAGRPPLFEDFWAEAKRHRLDLGGDDKVVKLDLLRQDAHRAKSAFLHRTSFLGIPMFAPLEDGQGPPWFKGADPLREEGRHLLGETWGIRGSEAIEDELLVLADRGVTVVEVATAELWRRRATAGTDLKVRTELVVHAARMRLHEALPTLLRELGDTLPVSARFDERAFALRELLALATVHETLPTFGDPTVVGLVTRAFAATCLLLPTIGATRPEAAPQVLEDVRTLLRAATDDGVPTDRALLLEQLGALATQGEPLMRGAAAGACTAFGALGEREVAARMAVLFRGRDARAGAAYLEGVLQISRSVLVNGRRLFRAVHEALGALDDEVFAAVLPDLRRAFAVFVPAELEVLGVQVAEALAPPGPPVDDRPTAAQLERARRIDAQVSAALARATGPEHPAK